MMMSNKIDSLVMLDRIVADQITQTQNLVQMITNRGKSLKNKIRKNSNKNKQKFNRMTIFFQLRFRILSRMISMTRRKRRKRTNMKKYL